MKKLAIFIFMVGIAAVLTSCTTATTRKAEALYDAYMASDTARFQMLYVHATPEAIELFESYLDTDRYLKAEAAQAAKERAAKREEARKYFPVDTLVHDSANLCPRKGSVRQER